MEKAKNMKPETETVSESLNQTKALTRPITGIVTARKCPHCNHHEIGMTTGSGDFIAFTPGLKIMVEPKR